MAANSSYQCPKCFLEYDCFHDMLIHQMKGHLPPTIQQGPAFCKRCDKFRESFLETIADVDCRHESGSNKSSEESRVVVDEPNAKSSDELDTTATLCQICGEMFDSLWFLMNHQDRDHGQFGEGPVKRKRSATPQPSTSRDSDQPSTSKKKRKTATNYVSNYVSIFTTRLFSCMKR